MPNTRLSISSRPTRAEDEPFLLALYASTRAHEIAAWGWTSQQAQAFLNIQFKARSQWYRSTYPEAEYQVIISGEAEIGQTIIQRGKSDILLVDIALLPEFRNQGIGAALLNTLIEESRSRHLPVLLQVLRGNPAIHLYERSGFKIVGEDDMYLQMRREAD